MRSSGIITLWSQPAPRGSGPSPLLTSAVVHILLVGLAWMGLHLSEMQPVRPTEQFPLRFLTLDQPPIPPPRDLTSPTFPAPRQNTRTVSRTAPQLPAAQTQPLKTPKPPVAHAQDRPAASAPEGRPAQAARPVLQTNQPAAVETLLQPDLPPKVVPKISLLPQIVVWTPERPIVKALTPPPLKEVASANVRPAPWRPNIAPLVADVKIPPNTVTVDLPLPSPSTTTPIALPEQSPMNQILETAARESVSPTPARIASLTKLQLERGTVALPEINEIAPGSPNSLAGDGPAHSKGAGGAAPAQQSGAASSGIGKGARPSTLEANGVGIARNVKGDLSAVAQGSVPGPRVATSEPAAVPGTSFSPSLNTTLIRHPKDGQFNFVVVGSSVAEKYPDAPNPWGGRLAYSVYLHVGSRKNWILQYSLPKDAQAAAGAMTSQPKAPWPYLIVRPHLPSDEWNSDAIMVHGFVDTNGHFQKLAVIFPPEFSEANFIVSSLNQWAFRPAVENGHAIAVEVLVVIPDQDE